MCTLLQGDYHSRPPGFLLHLGEFLPEKRPGRESRQDVPTESSRRHVDLEVKSSACRYSLNLLQFYFG